MAKENKVEGIGDPIKIFLEDALEKQRNAIMDNFAQIPQWLPTYNTSASNNHSKRCHSLQGTGKL